MMKIRSRVLAALLSVVSAILYTSGLTSASAGTLLPPGEQTFFDNNGLPLSAGCVFFYIPGTLSPKATFQNAAQTVSNTNPVQLDAAGRAIIYGTGTYRQVINAVGPNGNCLPAGAQIWDQITADTSSSNVIFAGASSGTPNSITVNAPAFSGTDGQVINYISTNTNSAAATINPSGFGNVQIVRDSATGPGALIGGELVATNAVSLIYDATAGEFHILSPVTWPNTAGVPVGTIIDVAGFAVPTNYAFAFGQAVNRVSFAALFSALTSAQTGSISNGSPTITGLSDTTQFAFGQPVEAIGIPTNTTLLSCTSTTCTMSQNATATRSGTMTFFAYGDGDGSITFNLPDYRGVALAGRDNMGGVARNELQVAANLTTTVSSTSATVSSATGLAIGMSITGNPNVAANTTISAISGTTITLSQNATASQTNVASRFSLIADAQGLGITGGSPTRQLATANLPPYTPTGNVATNITQNANIRNAFNAQAGGVPVAQDGAATITASSNFTGNAQGGTSIPVATLQPISTVNKAIKLTP